MTSLRADEVAAIVNAHLGDSVMVQVADYPHALEDAIAAHECKPGWSFRLAHKARSAADEPLSWGLTFEIVVVGPDAYHPETKGRGVRHLFIVPAATYDFNNWRRWIFDRCFDVEHHETAEWFRDSNGDRPYAPNHGPGQDPYFLREVSTPEQRATSNRGIIKGGNALDVNPSGFIGSTELNPMTCERPTCGRPMAEHTIYHDPPEDLAAVGPEGLFPNRAIRGMHCP